MGLKLILKAWDKEVTAAKRLRKTFKEEQEVEPRISCATTIAAKEISMDAAAAAVLLEVVGTLTFKQQQWKSRHWRPFLVRKFSASFPAGFGKSSPWLTLAYSS